MEMDDDAIRGLRELSKYKVKRGSSKHDKLTHEILSRRKMGLQIKHGYYDLPIVGVEVVYFSTDSSLVNSIGMAQGESLDCALHINNISKTEATIEERWGALPLDEERIAQTEAEMRSGEWFKVWR